MKFVEYVHPNRHEVSHIAEARVTTTERLFLREHALSFPALNDQPNVHRAERILIGARAVWAVVVLELEGAVRAGTLTGTDRAEAKRLARIIRVAVHRNRFHYHGIG